MENELNETDNNNLNKEEINIEVDDEDYQLDAKYLWYTSNTVGVIGALVLTIASFIPFLFLNGTGYTLETLLHLGSLSVPMHSIRAIYIIAYLVFIGAFIIFKLVNDNTAFIISCISCIGSIVLLLMWVYIMITMNTSTVYPSLTVDYGFAFNIGGCVLNIFSLVIGKYSITIMDRCNNDEKVIV